MSNLNEFVTAMKKASLESMDAAKPVQIVFGTVESIEPLKIRINQKLILGKAQLMLCRSVTDYTLEMTVDHMTETHTHNHRIYDTYSGGGSSEMNTHSHAYKGKKSFLVHGALQVGEKVILVREQGGQKYLVIDRVVSA